MLQISSNSEVVMLEISEKFVELTRNDPNVVTGRVVLNNGLTGREPRVPQFSF